MGKCIDIIDNDELNNYFSGCFDRIDKKVHERLVDCARYVELENRSTKIINENHYIDEITTSLTIENRTYSYDEIMRLSEYLNIISTLRIYEDLETYKQGFKDCYKLIKSLEGE